MCSRYFLSIDTMGSIWDIVKETDEKLRKKTGGRDIRPSDDAPVLIKGSYGIKLSQMKWGYPGINGLGLIINARAESVQEKKMFEGGIRHHRAVIPADYFYEWNKNGEKNTFRRKDKNPVYMAGFYDITGIGERFVIITTRANASMAGTHDRMPLVLEKCQTEDWLLDDGAVGSLLRQTPVMLDRETEYEQQTLFDLF